MAVDDLSDKFDCVTPEARIATLCFGITLFSDVAISTFGAGLLQALADYRLLVGPHALKVYLTDTMRMHKPITARSAELLDVWLAPGAPARETIGLEYTDADPYEDAPRHRFWVGGDEVPEAADTWPSMIRMSFNSSWGTQRPIDAIKWVARLAELIPIRSGYAGFAFEYSRYFLEEGCEHAWRQSMRYPGIEIHTPPGVERFGVLKDSIYTSNWLTIIDHAFVRQLGGLASLKKRLPASVQTYDIRNAVLLRIGEKPALGNVNRNDRLPDYREVNRVLEPLMKEVPDRLNWLDLPQDAEQDTLKWYRRWTDA
ncbi:hypothetical protein BG58_03505 [Caballeronia jiangsuensis]|nr:hypothetical protein BG58_03505 [Caballeronia jiangsuensis]